MILSRSIRASGMRSELLCSAGMAFVTALTIPGIGHAQQVSQNATVTESGSSSAEAQAVRDTADIVVTGSRIVRDGYQAPTPTTVLGAAEIAARAPTNLADFVNILPALSGSSTPRTTISAVSAGNAGINALNLRNLGVNRTLVLLDGQRVGPSSLAGFVDINQFPQALVSRVDVVTGGASASYGSDAVAGVVNFVLDKTFTGVKGEVQGGVTTYGDNRSYRATLTAGTKFAGDRGHLLVSGEIAHNDGVQGIGDRKWYNATKILNNPAYTATNGQPFLLVRPDTGFATLAPGGIITSGALLGTYFGEGGTPQQLQTGSIVSGNFMVGGQSRYTDFATTGDLDPKLSRQTAFFRTSFEITDDIEIFGQVSYGRAASNVAFGNQYKFASITINSNPASAGGINAFIPAATAARLAALGINSFTLGTSNQDLGPITVTTKRNTWRPVIGVKGNFDAVGSNWQWDAYAQKSISRAYIAANLMNNTNYDAAVDSVRNANGTIVCRSTLTNPNNGCVPYNVFGTGVNNQAAIDYIMQTDWARTKLKQDVYAANLRGEPFSTWAGPVSIAAGIEHRRESVSGSANPIVTTTFRPFFAGNYLPSFGSYHVTEGYFETLVPLAKDLSFAKRLELNGAVRQTDYSSSGSVTTWKAGLTYQPITDITFRATRSRDIRAGTLAELYQSNVTAASTLNDPFRNNASASYSQITAGNPNLKPEKADTISLGVILQPQFLPGFSASVDYYRIRIKDAITTLQGREVLDQCFAGNTALCANVVRNGAGVLTAIQIQPVNIAKRIAKGLDFEASYRRDLADIGLGGKLSLRGIATRYLKNYTNNGVNVPTDTVGTNYGAGSSAASLPKWTYLASIGWDQGPLSLLLTGRGFSAGVYNTSYVECTSGCPTSTTPNMTIENNHLPGAFYVDANISYKLWENVQVYLSVDNIANKAPAQVGYGTAIGGAPLSVNAALYDVLGRTFRTGVRFKM